MAESERERKINFPAFLWMLLMVLDESRSEMCFLLLFPYFLLFTTFTFFAFPFCFFPSVCALKIFLWKQFSDVEGFFRRGFSLIKFSSSRMFNNAADTRDAIGWSQCEIRWWIPLPIQRVNIWEIAQNKQFNPQAQEGEMTEVFAYFWSWVNDRERMPLLQTGKA